MIIKCPGCEMILEAAADAAGNSLQCTYCELTFVLEKQHHNSPALKKKKISIHRAVRKNSKIAQRKKVAKKSGVNKYLLSFGIVLTLAFLLVATVGLSQHDSTPEEKRISKSSRAVVSKPSNSLFKFDEWSKKYGQSVDVNEWMSNNPHPYGQRWDPKRSYFHSLYTTTLGPLGIRTRMHEQSWARLFQLQEKGFPKVLMDVYGPLMNALEVVHVHEKGPADTHVQKGDLILEIEGQALKSSLWVNLENKYKATERRGLEIHAGQMIDLAEGRGKIKLKVLRLPKTYKIKKIAPRAEKHIQTLETKALDTIQVKMNLPESQYLSIKAKTGNYRFLELAIVNQQGAKIYLNHLDRGTVFKNSNWSKNYINTKTGSWVAKGPFHFHIVMPPGKWQLRGEIKSESKKSEAIEFGYIKKAKLSAELKTYCKTVEFKIPRIGSFGKSFDPKSDKLRNYTATLAKRLSIQQAPDGSWPYIASFTSPSFYTSMCGLGLLAEDNPAYKKHIRKAAHYVAYSGQKSNWSWTHGINTMFLAEYYLRTKDKSILDGLSVALLACEKSLFVDYVAGHHASSPGYGGFGQISGSGAVACALAIAEHTPAKFTRGTALNMMATIQSLSPRGVIPYGRRTLGSLTKQAFKHEGFLKGQSAFAGTGLYYAAGKISGGSSFFNDVVTRRLETAPYGDLDGGHATHTLHFVFGIIAASISSPKAYKANLEAFLWKLTTHRGFDGLIVNNSNPMEHHSGEKVMGKPWWSTGGYLIMLNAHKRNLAMTGKEKYMASSQKELPLIHNADLKIYRHVLRQWCTVENALGKKTPDSVTAVIKKLVALKKTATYGMDIIALLKKYAVRCARDVAQLRLKDKQLQNYCMEILLGVDHNISLSQNKPPKKTKRKRKRKVQQYVKGYTLKINSMSYYAHCYPVLPMTSKSANPLPELVSQGSVSICDKNGRALKGLKLIKLDNNNLAQEFLIAEIPETDKLYAHFTYKCGGVIIDYKRELVLKEQEHLRKVWISGKLKDTGGGWRRNIILPSKIVYHGSDFEKGLVLADAQGKKLPIKHITWGRDGSAYFPLKLPLTAGSQAKFLVSTGHLHEGRVHEIRIAEPYRNNIKDISYSLKKGELVEGRLGNMSDYDPDTTAKLKSDSDNTIELEFSCKKTSLTKLYRMAGYKPKGGMSYKLEYYHKASWHACKNGILKGLQGFYSFAPTPESSRFRMSMHWDKPFTINVFELHLLK